MHSVSCSALDQLRTWTSAGLMIEEADRRPDALKLKACHFSTMLWSHDILTKWGTYGIYIRQCSGDLQTGVQRTIELRMTKSSLQRG